MNNVSFQLAISSLRRQKTRSILTILGISIGIAVVITIMSAGKGLDNLIMGEVEMYGSDMIEVETKVPNTKKTSMENAMGQASGVTITTLKNKDLEALLSHPNISSGYGMLMGQAIASYGSINKSIILMGEGYNLQEVEKFELDAGRIFTKEEENGLAQVAVIGSSLKEKLFGDEDALGKMFYISKKPFRVVGVAEKRGTALFIDMDSIAIIPTETMQKKVLGIDYLQTIVMKMKDADKSKETAAELNEIMRVQHDITDPNKDDFATTTMEEALSILKSIVGGITFLLVALVCVSLVVGGVGIMNIMYVSVTERTFEIGLRKALGAKNHDILFQFLLEAILLTTCGGVAGIIFGAIFSLVVYLTAVSYNLAWIYSIPISSILLSVGFSAFVGLLFGIYPARRAANLDPIVALRRE
ncbi:MAG: ABC transporter permease [Patescibacteria group bacterium]|nr:ABC transporter permease [Patescibacteria group bacterium]